MKYTGYFHIIDYSLTHSVLLLRTEDIINKDNINEMYVINTDLKFLSVYYLELPAYFYDLEIEEANEADCQYILGRCDPKFVPSVTPKDVYVLKTNGKRYFIGARRLIVETSNQNI